jgi:carbon monoxide dehydrogenase subunit G
MLVADEVSWFDDAETRAAVVRARGTIPADREVTVEADHDAPVCESGEVTIDARPEAVWDTLTDLQSWPRWMPGVKKMSVDPPLRVGSKFEWKAGPGTIRSVVIDSDRPRTVGWRGRTLGIEAIHVWRMESQGTGTRVVTEESWAGLLARVLRGMMRKSVRKALDDALPALRDEAQRRNSSHS